MSDEEIESAIGVWYTHACCPYCSYENQYEDDVRGHVVKCEDCEKEFVVS